MYPTAYTLTVLVLTLLQYSFDKRYAKNACQNGVNQDNNSTLCDQNMMRKEIRQLSKREFNDFVQVFNDYSTRNDTDELNSNINELGVVQTFDELLQSKQMLTPYWEYRLEVNASNPEASALWSAPQFEAINQANDAQWLIEFIENENQAEDDEFFGDDPFSKLWKRRRAALKVMRNVKRTDVFWHLLLLVSIETGLDQNESQINRTSCVRDYGKFTRWVNESCQVSLRDGEECKSSGDCFNRRCSKNKCASTKRPITTTKLPKIETEKEDILNVTLISNDDLLLLKILTEESVTTTQETYKFKLKPPAEFNNKMAATTEFLANELTTASPQRKKKKHRKKNRKFATTTTPEPHHQIPPTEYYHDPTSPSVYNSSLINDENNSPIEQENYGKDTLDALLPYLPTPKVPSMISWTSKMPIRMTYFSFTIIEGSLGKQRRLKNKGNRRAKGARIYLRGLDMPSGYTQVTQGRQMRSGIGAMARTLDPDNNEPFVEFKMRVENRYGTPCKQLCLDSHHRYRRCARRTIRLSPYKKFSDPIPYFGSENQAMNGQYTGKGYFKKWKLTYLLFKCD